MTIPAKLLTDIDKAQPTELWEGLLILADWLEECGDLRADGIRWLVNEKVEVKFIAGAYRGKEVQMFVSVWSKEPESTLATGDTKSAAYLAAAQAFVAAKKRRNE